MSIHTRRPRKHTFQALTTSLQVQGIIPNHPQRHSTTNIQRLPYPSPRTPHQSHHHRSNHPPPLTTQLKRRPTPRHQKQRHAQTKQQPHPRPRTYAKRLYVAARSTPFQLPTNKHLVSHATHHSFHFSNQRVSKLTNSALTSTLLTGNRLVVNQSFGCRHPHNPITSNTRRPGTLLKLNRNNQFRPGRHTAAAPLITNVIAADRGT